MEAIDKKIMSFKKIDTIIYIIETKLSRNDLVKFGFNFYKKKGIEVNFYNVSPLSRKNYFQNYEFNNDLLDNINHKYFFSIKDLVNDLKKTNNKAIFSILPTTGKIYNNLYKELNNFNLKYNLIISGKLPIPTLEKKELIFLMLKYPFQASIKIVKKILNNKRDLYCKPEYVFTSSADLVNKQNKIYIKIPSYDYDEILNYEINHQFSHFKRDRKYLLYIETPPDHPDGIYAKHRFPPEKPCSINDWFNPLNSFLKKIREISGYDILVLPHPRSTKESLRCLKHCQIETRANKIPLFTNCEGVITQASSAISYAVYYNKPILFIDQKYLTFHNRRSISSLSKFFKKKSIDMNSLLNQEILDAQFKIDDISYINFKKNYLGYPSNKTSHEIIVSILNKTI